MRNPGARCTPGRVDVQRLFSSGSASHALILDDEFDVKAGFTPLLQLGKRPLAAGCYFYAAVLDGRDEPRPADAPS